MDSHRRRRSVVEKVTISFPADRLAEVTALVKLGGDVIRHGGGPRDVQDLVRASTARSLNAACRRAARRKKR